MKVHLNSYALFMSASHFLHCDGWALDSNLTIDKYPAALWDDVNESHFILSLNPERKSVCYYSNQTPSAATVSFTEIRPFIDWVKRGCNGKPPNPIFRFSNDHRAEIFPDGSARIGCFITQETFSYEQLQSIADRLKPFTIGNCSFVSNGGFRITHSQSEFIYGREQLLEFLTLVEHTRNQVKPHNPDNITEWGVSEGYRLLDEDEVDDKYNDGATKWLSEIEQLYNGHWDNSGWKGGRKAATYRTKLSRQELATLRAI